MSLFTCEVVAESGPARTLRYTTAHGDFVTPMFMPVGTHGTVKGLTPAELEEAGAQVVLANTYHLAQRPGADVIAELGGIHRFMAYDGPILTDSGGFQVFSLADTLRIDDERVTFRSIYDGSQLSWTPEDNMAVQEAIGADIAMQLDQCAPYPATYEEVGEAVERSRLWARRCLAAHKRPDQALFGIVQGGVHRDLRLSSVKGLLAIERESQAAGGRRFDGFGIGGYSVGEPHEMMFETLGDVVEALPADRPRYLMGVGNPTTLVRAIAVGVDMFDCVLATRTGRMGTAFSSMGRMNLRNAQYARDPGPVDETCDCYACTHFSRAAIRHYFNQKEMLGSILLSIHNIRYLTRLMEQARQAITAGRYDEFVAAWLASPAAHDY